MELVQLDALPKKVKGIPQEELLELDLSED